MSDRKFANLHLIVPFFMLFALPAGDARSAEPTDSKVLILVAASTKDAMTELAAAFEKDGGGKVVISAGPSNALANQIINGAPGDLFLSANQQWADKVKAEGLAAELQPLLTNGLVLIVPKDNPGKVTSQQDLRNAKVKHLALAGENVPAGIYAQQALKAAKVYDDLVDQKKIVRGQDVRATLNFVARGEAEAGIVYSTDAKISDQVAVVHTFDPQSYDKIVYPLLLTKRGKENPAAVKFQQFLLSDKATEVFAKHGFTRLK